MWNSEAIDIPYLHDVLANARVDKCRDFWVIGLPKFGDSALCEPMDNALKV